MKILLDEDFPLALYRSLKGDGEDVEHIITLGLRGTPDQQVRRRLFDKDVLFLTHDEDFLFGRPTEAIVVLSRVRQARRLGERVDVWRRAILELIRNPKPERRFELMDDRLLAGLGRGAGPKLEGEAASTSGPDARRRVGEGLPIQASDSDRGEVAQPGGRPVPTGDVLVHHTLLSDIGGSAARGRTRSAKASILSKPARLRLQPGTDESRHHGVDGPNAAAPGSARCRGSRLTLRYE
ncbi:MAG: DUF5615 family PIN-like protein [Acidobacteria bacterium]|nr:DUF5615 family PIN-like protein [Acidobacteriota bacterium]